MQASDMDLFNFGQEAANNFPSVDQMYVAPKLFKPEPYFTIINDLDHFRVLCTSHNESGEDLRQDTLIIEKKGCIIYSRGK